MGKGLAEILEKDHAYYSKIISTYDNTKPKREISLQAVVMLSSLCKPVNLGHSVNKLKHSPFAYVKNFLISVHLFELGGLYWCLVFL